VDSLAWRVCAVSSMGTRLHVLQPITQHHPESIALGQSERGEPRGQTVHAVAEIRPEQLEVFLERSNCQCVWLNGASLL
jgi:hypothetical protein